MARILDIAIFEPPTLAQYEAILKIRGCGIEIRAKTFSALTKKIIARIKEEKAPII